MPFALTCPTCHVYLDALGIEARVCERCAVVYRRERRIWRFLTGEGEAAVRSFTERYSMVRRDEGRCMVDAVRLEGLPFRGFSRKHAREWFVRSRSFEALVRRVVEPLKRKRHRKKLQILDLGSGVGWLANRLARWGHDVAAIDIVTDDFGLGVHRHYRAPFLSVQADFERLPFASATVDLAIFNASFHYARDGGRALSEALRVLAVGGRVVIMDSPIYRDGSSGDAMVRERERAFERRYGLRGGSVPSDGFLTYDMLEGMKGAFALKWALHQPWYGLRWWAKPHVARLRKLREPAQFKLVVGQRLGES
jgi:SAM-dependent methyltransferase